MTLAWGAATIVLMHRRGLLALVMAASFAGALGAGACSSFDSAPEVAPTLPEASLEGSTADADAPDGAAGDAAPSRCEISTASTAKPRVDCLGPGSVVDVNVSPLHCGRCGHDCLDAPCVGGLCSPQVVHSPGASVVGDVTATAVFYTSGGDVQRSSVDGPNIVDVVARTASPGYFMRTFVREDDRLFVVTSNSNVNEYGVVPSIASGDSGITPLLTTTGGGLAADTHGLYFVSYASVFSVNKSTGAQATVQTNVEADEVRGLAGRDDEVYWTLVRAAPDGGTVEHLLFVRRADGTVVERARDIGLPGGLALDAMYVYSADTTTGSIMRALRAGTTAPAVVARWPGTDRYVKALLVAGATVYWTVSVDSQGGADVTLYEAPTCAAGGSVVVTSHPAGEFNAGLFANTTHLYYGGLSGVHRVARQGRSDRAERINRRPPRTNAQERHVPSTLAGSSRSPHEAHHSRLVLLLLRGRHHRVRNDDARRDGGRPGWRQRSSGVGAARRGDPEGVEGYGPQG